jgi:hypothetical protein
VIVEDIDEDTGGVPVVATYPPPTSVNDGVRVRERINRLVMPHAVKKSRRHGDTVSPLHEIRQQIAEAKLDVRLRQQYMCQPVQDAPSALLA